MSSGSRRAACLLAGFAALSTLADPARAGFVGRESMVFTALAGDARHAALGAAGNPTADGETALDGNPAAMALRREYGFAATHLVWPDGFTGETVTAELPAGYNGVLGATGFLLLHDPLPVTTEILPDGNGSQSALLSAQVALAAAAWATEGVAIGAGTRVAQARAGDDVTMAMVVDAGTVVVISPELIAGAAVRGLGQLLKARSARDPFPLEWQVGARYAPQEFPVAGLAGGVFPSWGPIRGGLGAELGEWYGGSVRCMAELAEFGRFGYAIGVGAHHDMWNLDYAFAPAGVLGYAHRFTLAIRFGRRANE